MIDRKQMMKCVLNFIDNKSEINKRKKLCQN
jgi:hypothetical protein